MTESHNQSYHFNNWFSSIVYDPAPLPRGEEPLIEYLTTDRGDPMQSGDPEIELAAKMQLVSDWIDTVGQDSALNYMEPLPPYITSPSGSSAHALDVYESNESNHDYWKDFYTHDYMPN